MRARLLLLLVAAAGAAALLLLWQEGPGRDRRQREAAASGPSVPAPSPAAGAGDATEEAPRVAPLPVRVVAADGSPVAGATVGVVRDGGVGEGILTDAEGRARVPREPAPWWVIGARHPEYRYTEQWVRPDFEGELLLQMEPAAPLTVIVLAPDKAPVADALVRVVLTTRRGPSGWWSWTSEDKIGQARTDAAGRARIGGAPERELQVSVDHPDYALHASPLDVRGTAAIEHIVILDRGAVVVGRVVDAAGVGIGGADVKVADASRPATKSGPDGSFRLEGVGAGDVRVLAQAEGYGPGYFGEHLGWGEAVPVPLRAGQLIDNVEIVLRPPTWVTGRIVDEEGKGVKGASAGAWIRGAYAVSQVAATDEEGRFRIGPYSLREPGQIYLWFYNTPDHAFDQSQPGDARPGEDFDAGTITGRTKAVLRGRVVDGDGRPAPGAQVVCNPGHNGEAAKDGTFEIRGVNPGKVVVRATRREPAQASLPQALEVAAREVRDGLELTLLPVAAVRGRVITPDGEPRPGVILGIRPADLDAGIELTDSHVWSDGEGRFAFEMLAPGKYEVGVSGSGATWIYAEQEVTFLEDPPPQTVEAGGEELELVFPLKGGIVTAKVVSRRDGLPVKEFDATFIRYKFFLPHDSDNSSYADGAFRREVAEPGTWQVDISADGFAPHRTARFSLGAGETKDLGTIRLGGGGTLAGLVRDAQGAAVAFARINILNEKLQTNEDEPFTDLDGRFRLKGISPGLYTVFAVSPRHPLGMVRNVEVEEESVTEVAIDFLDAAPLTLEVRDEAGEPVAGAKLDFTFPAIAPLTSKLFRNKIPPGYGSHVSDAAGVIYQHCLPPGEVTITIEADGFRPGTKKLDLAPGEKNRIQVRLERAP